ncbi:hypothetical protein [Treponema sp.]|uniref:hypothetical protein n=1 Tax=Treponema sp. TaxID=166 RepID=UPI00388E9DA3
MKKIELSIIFAVALISANVFAEKPNKSAYDEVSGGLYSRNVSEGMIENPTPENSVLVYGATGEDGSKLWFADKNSNWQTTVETTFMTLILPPVPKGADVKLKQGGFFKHETTGGMVGIVPGKLVYNTTDTWYEITNTEWNFKVPKDKSLYFIGYHSILLPGSNTYEGMKAAWEKYTSENNVIGGIPNSQEKYDKYMLKMEIKVLKKLQKQYKGTDWEPLIKDRIAEASAELKK